MPPTGAASGDQLLLAEVAQVAAFGTPVRGAAVLDRRPDRPLADSGSPWLMKPRSVDSSAAPAGQGAHDPSQGGQDPGQSGQASGRGGQAGVQTGPEQPPPEGRVPGKVYERAAEAGSPGGVAYVRLSQGPAEGTDVMNWICPGVGGRRGLRGVRRGARRVPDQPAHRAPGGRTGRGERAHGGRRHRVPARKSAGAETPPAGRLLHPHGRPGRDHRHRTAALRQRRGPRVGHAADGAARRDLQLGAGRRRQRRRSRPACSRVP